MINTLFFFMLCGLCVAYAQAVDPLAVVAGRFQDSLKELKDSAGKLAAGNSSLSLQNQGLREYVVQAQLRLARLVEENNLLTRSTLKLQDNNPVRARKLAQLEKEIFDIEKKMEDLGMEGQGGEETARRFQEEDRRLTARIKEIGLNPPPAVVATAPPVSLADHRANEKLRLLKMIYESKEKQETLNQQILETHRQRPFSVITVEKSSDKGHLLAQIKDLQAEIDTLNTPVMDITVQGLWDPEQLRQLEAQVKDLQRNADELEALSMRMRLRMGKAVLSRDQINEQNRLRGTFESLTKEGRKLRSQLARLRQKMVHLDKREVLLESWKGHSGD